VLFVFFPIKFPVNSNPGDLHTVFWYQKTLVKKPGQKSAQKSIEHFPPCLPDQLFGRQATKSADSTPAKPLGHD